MYKRYPDKDEGYLTKFKSKIVNRDHLNNIAINLEINQFVVAQSSNFHNIKYINGNAFEALIGALFLDKGYNRTRKFIVDKLLKKRVDVESLKTIDNDFKSMLIEWGQKYKREIIFNTEEDFQSKDAIPWFISDILIESKKFGTGKGKSKKEAEQNASKDALTRIKDNKPINM